MALSFFDLISQEAESVPTFSDERANGSFLRLLHA
jgi:hypothetical protein